MKTKISFLTFLLTIPAYGMQRLASNSLLINSIKTTINPTRIHNLNALQERSFSLFSNVRANKELNFYRITLGTIAAGIGYIWYNEREFEREKAEYYKFYEKADQEVQQKIEAAVAREIKENINTDPIITQAVNEKMSDILSYFKKLRPYTQARLLLERDAALKVPEVKERFAGFEKLAACNQIRRKDNDVLTEQLNKMIKLNQDLNDIYSKQAQAISQEAIKIVGGLENKIIYLSSALFVLFISNAGFLIYKLCN